MKSQTLKENKDFRRLYYRGKSKAADCLVTYSMKNREKHCRYGITTSKKIGNAVQRNRARRVIRAAYSLLEPRLQGHYDLVFVARSKTADVKMQTVYALMEKQLIALGVIHE
ncbi:MAG: ribonuclease P protein component [Eubacterium sp.]|nr:ribonuclease P protein component [Eubacterium sp.]